MSQPIFVYPALLLKLFQVTGVVMQEESAMIGFNLLDSFPFRQSRLVLDELQVDGRSDGLSRIFLHKQVC